MNFVRKKKIISEMYYFVAREMQENYKERSGSGY